MDLKVYFLYFLKLLINRYPKDSQSLPEPPRASQDIKELPKASQSSP
jgi:hypothetical protein